MSSVPSNSGNSQFLEFQRFEDIDYREVVDFLQGVGNFSANESSVSKDLYPGTISLLKNDVTLVSLIKKIKYNIKF